MEYTSDTRCSQNGKNVIHFDENTEIFSPTGVVTIRRDKSHFLMGGCFHKKEAAPACAAISTGHFEAVKDPSDAAAVTKTNL